MKTITNILFFVSVLVLTSCNKQDTRIHLRSEVASDTLADNIVTRPVAYAFSALIGEGIEITEAVTRKNETGILELYVNGFNRSQHTKRFKYRVEWLDKDGLLIQTKTSVWLRVSAIGKSPFSFKVVAPTPEAVNFRMDTKKWE